MFLSKKLTIFAILIFFISILFISPIFVYAQDATCIPENGMGSLGQGCDQVTCCAGLICKTKEISRIQDARIGTSTIDVYAQCVKSTSGDQIEPPSMFKDGPIEFKPQVTIPGSITIAGKAISFNAGEGVAVDGDLINYYIAVFFKFFIGFLAVCAVIMVMWGGFKRIIAAGNAERISDANDAIFSALIGLVLALLSYTLLNLINPDLVSPKSLEIYQVRREEWTGERSDTGVSNTPSSGGYYKQCDPQWGTMPYVEDNNKSCNLCSSGCGATATAIVLKNKGINVTPRDVGQYAIQMGARQGCTNGTNVRRLLDKPKSDWGVKNEIISDFNTAMMKLDAGIWLIASIKKVPVPGKCEISDCGTGVCFCGGHYVVLAGKKGDNIYVIDPSRVGLTSISVSDLKKYLNNGFYYVDLSTTADEVQDSRYHGGAIK